MTPPCPLILDLHLSTGLHAPVHLCRYVATFRSSFISHYRENALHHRYKFRDKSVYMHDHMTIQLEFFYFFSYRGQSTLPTHKSIHGHFHKNAWNVGGKEKNETIDLIVSS